MQLGYDQSAQPVAVVGIGQFVLGIGHCQRMSVDDADGNIVA